MCGVGEHLLSCALIVSAGAPATLLSLDWEIRSQVLEGKAVFRAGPLTVAERFSSLPPSCLSASQHLRPTGTKEMSFGSPA